MGMCYGKKLSEISERIRVLVYAVQPLGIANGVTPRHHVCRRARSLGVSGSFQCNGVM